MPVEFPDESSFPIPGNYWARGLPIELHQFIKVYRAKDYKRFPSAAGYDYKGTKWVQMKSVADPTKPNAIIRMKTAIDDLVRKASDTAEGGNAAQMILHIVTRDADSSAMRAALDSYVIGKNYEARLQIIIEQFVP